MRRRRARATAPEAALQVLIYSYSRNAPGMDGDPLSQHCGSFSSQGVNAKYTKPTRTKHALHLFRGFRYFRVVRVKLFFSPVTDARITFLILLIEFGWRNLYVPAR
jgi:hypothetical protein